MKILLLLLLIVLFPISVYSQTKIMAIGESTTSDPSGYRKKFYDLAIADGLSIDMVGPNSNGTGYDADNAGYTGYTCLDLINKLRSFYKYYSPDIVLLLEGTNDCGWNFSFYPTIPPIDELSLLIDTICLKYPDALIFISSIPPMLDNAFTEPEHTPFGVARANAILFNNAILDMINIKIASGKKLYFINARALLNDTDILSDGIHPNQNGYDKIGELFYNTVKPFIVGTAKVYPNPLTNQYLTIDLNTEMPLDISLTLYSRTGSIVFFQNDLKYTSIITIPLPQSLSAGIYFLIIKYKIFTIKKKIIILK